jgi:RNA polymerase-binding transcription factor DksA
MAADWPKEGAVHEQIDATLKGEASSVESRLPQSSGLAHCTECGAAMLHEARRDVIPSARLCIACQEAQDRDIVRYYHRRGSKDSQPR